MIANLSVATLPVTLLALGDGDRVLNSEEWEIQVLKNSVCVGVWKDGGNPGAPDIACTQVGSRLIGNGQKRFWRDSFNVYFNGVLVKTCEKKEIESGCIVTFTFP